MAYESYRPLGFTSENSWNAYNGMFHRSGIDWGDVFDRLGGWLRDNPDLVLSTLQLMLGDNSPNPSESAEDLCCRIPKAVRGFVPLCIGKSCADDSNGTTQIQPGPEGTRTMGILAMGGVEPMIVQRNVRICPRDANGVRYRLGKDGKCYPKLTEAQRMYKSRTPKVSKGEWNSLMKAKGAAKKFDSVEKTLHEISSLTKKNVTTKTKKVCWSCGKNPCQCNPSR